MTIEEQITALLAHIGDCIEGHGFAPLVELEFMKLMLLCELERRRT